MREGREGGRGRKGKGERVPREIGKKRFGQTAKSTHYTPPTIVEDQTATEECQESVGQTHPANGLNQTT